MFFVFSYYYLNFGAFLLKADRRVMTPSAYSKLLRVFLSSTYRPTTSTHRLHAHNNLDFDFGRPSPLLSAVTMADDAQPPPETKLLPDAPTDGVSRMLYLPTSTSSSPRLASTSWDGTVCLYDTSDRKRVLSHAMESGPLLSLAAPSTMNTVVTGGLDGSIRMLDFETSNLQTIGRHGMESSDGKVACSCLAALSSLTQTQSGTPALIASAGWDRQFHVWDIRQQTPVATVKLPGKAFSMDYDAVHDRVVVATSGRRTCFFDVRNPASVDSTMVLERESSLKYQTRCVRFFPDGAAIALGSVEGRVAVEFLDELNVPSAGGRKKYAFKCHRSGDLVYPVNCIEFHPSYGTFATGGCDGSVGTYCNENAERRWKVFALVSLSHSSIYPSFCFLVLWDGLNKKKLTTLPPFPTSISTLAFSPDGTELAIASSYTFEDGERAHPRDEIYVRKVLDHECRPKSKE